MLENITENNKDFFTLREEPSDKFEGLSKSQELTIHYLTLGYSYSKIAKEIYGIHYCTLLKDCKSLNFCNCLNKVNQSQDILTLQEVKQVLSDIIRKENNANIRIKACQTLIGLSRTINIDQLAEIVQGNEMTQSEARETLERLGISVGDE